jgi:hypothetical protein
MLKPPRKRTKAVNPAFSIGILQNSTLNQRILSLLDVEVENMAELGRVQNMNDESGRTERPLFFDLL